MGRNDCLGKEQQYSRNPIASGQIWRGSLAVGCTSEKKPPHNTKNDTQGGHTQSRVKSEQSGNCHRKVEQQ